MGSSESKMREPKKDHSLFDWDHQVIRRGESYTFSFKEKSRLNYQEYAEGLSYTLKANGEIIDQNKILQSETAPLPPSWNLKVVENSDHEINIQLESHCHCDIGEYEATLMRGSKVITTEKFLMLFNPWNKYDEAYMEDDAGKNEYILNTETVIFYGLSNNVKSVKWFCSQFSRPCILTFLKLLAKIPRPARSFPYTFAKELTTILTNEHNGLLLVPRKKIYTNGTSPDKWTDSSEIFEEFINNNEIVKFGHAVSISGVLCSLFRLVGICCRPVTCFDCAHDNDDTLDLEIYYDDKFRFMREISNDYVHTFHTWNECFIRHSNFDEYNGWQVFDAYPKRFKRSKGDIYKVCGPAPVYVIKEGDLNVGDNTRYIFSEVNARVIQMIHIDGEPRPLLVQSSKVGTKILTKAIENNKEVDITDCYKFKKGSQMDEDARIAAETALAEDKSIKKLYFSIEGAQNDSTIMGNDVMLKIDLLNNQTKTDVTFKCSVIRFPNILSDAIQTHKITFDPKKSNTRKLKLDGGLIFDQLNKDLCSLLVEAFYTHENNSCKEDVCYAIEHPIVDIQILDKLVYGRKCEVNINMKNSIPFNMENVKVLLQVERLCGENQERLIKKVNQGGVLKAKFNIVPKKLGSNYIRVEMMSPSFPNFYELKEINVVSA